MTYLYYGFGFLVFVIVAILAIGAVLPVKHVAARNVVLSASPAKIWLLISGYADMPQWRKELLKVEMKLDGDGNEIWQEFESEKESLDFITIEQIDGQKLVRKIVGDKLDFGGTWTFELVENDGKTTLTITENGEVYNILFRFVSKFIMGHYASMDKYIKQLETAL
ncbi:MAG: SRPBCC family protein [Alphaproteobacteria bacterium]|nr:SRPBCC family protein [Alphaproteobacteria bacterium]